MRKVIFLGVLAFFFAAYAAAIDLENFDFSKGGLLKNTFISGDITYAIYAPADVNVFLLVKDVNLAGGETVDSIQKKIDALRVKLYPDKEFVLEITAPKVAGVVGSSRYTTMKLMNKILGPGQTISAVKYGWDVGVLVYLVHYGSCKWEYRRNGPWVYWGTTPDFLIHSGILYGSEGVRGFRVTGLKPSKIDIHLWWVGD